MCVVCVYCAGGVCADRQLKMTRLPASLESGRVITFETELIAMNKVRVTVEVCEKVITFDWQLPTRTAEPAVNALPINLVGLGDPAARGASADTNKVSLFFFTRLSHAGTRVTVV